MSKLLKYIQKLIEKGDVRISEHGYDELADDNLKVEEIMNGIGEAQKVEEYPDYPKGRCKLVLQEDMYQNPVHVLWGIPKGHHGPAVLITAYRPDPARWDASFLNRT